MADQNQTTPPKPPTEPPGGPNPSRIPDLRRWLWFAIMAVWAIWIWQFLSQQTAEKTIPYSEFKTYLHDGRVDELMIQPDVILGQLKPSEKQASATKSGEAASSSTEAAPKPAQKAETETVAQTKPEAAAQAKATHDAGETTKPASETSTGKTPSAPKQAAQPERFRTVRVDDPDLVKGLDAANVKYTAVQPSVLGKFFWSWVAPIAVLGLIWVFIARYAGRMMSPAMSFGRNKAKIYAEKLTGVTFEDVAGCDEAKVELKEIIEFLKSPERYTKIGAHVPKGVLLVGPPGTGKTLLARAVAGEAGVTFFSLSGSEFVEMFVGVGASRVRDLFTQAKAAAPCIVFIDELDAIGRQRGIHMGVVNDEREQTLNQLLVELDGFELNTGVIILSATNRPEVLDKALLRPGRFDRQVVLDAPDIDGREAILKVHTKKSPLGPEVDLRAIAAATPGFSGADLANLVNEGGLLAVRGGRDQISQKDLEEAVEKVIAGPERKSRRLSDAEKSRVAFHETGHALVSWYSKHADPVHKITIVPRGRAALGYTMQLPTEEQYLVTKEELLDKIRGLLGGRAAEDVMFGDVSTGAQNDLEHATLLARQMVTLYGMSDKVGLTQCAHPADGMYLQGTDGLLQRDCSEETAGLVDEEVKSILDSCYADARGILATRKPALEHIAHELVRVETLDRKRFESLVKETEQEPDSKSSAAV